MGNDNIYLVLGCFGRRDDDFVSCSGIENRILLLSPTIVNYNDLMDYLENCRLFDRPLFEYNGIRHVIFNIREKFDQVTKRIWSEKKFTLYQKFTIDHRHCGLYLKLVLIPSELDEPPVKEPDAVFIKADDQERIPSLRLIKKSV